MTITNRSFNVHELDKKDREALERVEKIIEQLQDLYGEEVVLGSPNTGEIVCTEELWRFRGILNFIADNIVVEVNP
jgi:hypothetical protein